MINLPTLYPHQETMRDDLRSALVKHKRVILCAAPGTGKTRTAKHILGAFANRPTKANQSGRAMFAVHRRGLVDNASDSFAEDPQLPHGVIMSGRQTSVSKRIQVASIDTKNSWYCEGGEYTTEFTYDLIVFDECHSHISKLRTFLDAHERKRKQLGLHPAFVVGLSATPQHKELHKVFNHIVSGPSPGWLIEKGYLSPFRYFQCTRGRLDALVKRGDDYTQQSVGVAMQGLSGDLVRDWRKHADGRATIGFFPLRATAMEAMQVLRSNRIAAEYVDGETSDEDRRRMFRQLNAGEIDYICNVGVVERGTDIPRVGCVQMCTAVGSVVRWRQMIGRGSRRHPEKKDCIVLDHATGIKDHGFFEDEVEWTLEWGERPSRTHEPRDSLECPSCGAVYRGGLCRQCGYEPTAKERKQQGLVFDGGELREVKRKERSKTAKKTCAQIVTSALFIAGKRGLTFGQAWHIAKEMATRQGTKLRVPAVIEIAGNEYRTIPYGHPDSKRRVEDTYGITVGRDHPDDNPYLKSRLDDPRSEVH